MEDHILFKSLGPFFHLLKKPYPTSAIALLFSLSLYLQPSLLLNSLSFGSIFLLSFVRVISLPKSLTSDVNIPDYQKQLLNLPSFASCT